MSSSRRNFFRNAALFGTGLLGWSESLRAQMRGMARGGESDTTTRKDYQWVTTGANCDSRGADVATPAARNCDDKLRLWGCSSDG